MDYIKKTYTDKAVEVSNFFLCRERWGYRISRSARYYRPDIAVFRTTSRTSNGPMWQLSKRCYLTRCDCRLPALFPERRCQPSRRGDGLGMRKFLLPSFHRGASSTKREQNSHVDLVSDRYHCRNDQKRNVESQTQPLYTILDRGLLQ